MSLILSANGVMFGNRKVGFNVHFLLELIFCRALKMSDRRNDDWEELPEDEKALIMVIFNRHITEAYPFESGCVLENTVEEQFSSFLSHTFS